MEQAMNNEPVAWQHKVAESWVTTTKDGDDNEWIPLYTHPTKEPAKKRYDDCMKDFYEPNPIERLRFFLSFALTGQDWLDVEPFIDAISHPAKTLTDEEISIVKEAIGNYVCTIKMEIDQEKQTFKGYENCSNLPALRSELKDAEQALAILRKAQEQ